MDQHLEAGTEIGDDTPYPIPDGWAPGAYMEPLDDEAKWLTQETAKHKQNWGRPPEEGLPIGPRSGDHHPIIGTSVNRTEQPIIPPPMEHLTRPNDMRPHERGPRPNPLVEEALRQQNERLAAENDKRMAEEANRTADEKSREKLPPGVTVSNTGAQAKAPTTQLPGQGPAPKPSVAPGQGPGQKPKPPSPPSAQVPRDQAGSLTPSSPDGKHQDPAEKKE